MLVLLTCVSVIASASQVGLCPASPSPLPCPLPSAGKPSEILSRAGCACLNSRGDQFPPDTVFAAAREGRHVIRKHASFCCIKLYRLDVISPYHITRHLSFFCSWQLFPAAGRLEIRISFHKVRRRLPPYTLIVSII
jgi:hypothetical protein